MSGDTSDSSRLRKSMGVQHLTYPGSLENPRGSSTTKHESESRNYPRTILLFQPSWGALPNPSQSICKDVSDAGQDTQRHHSMAALPAADSVHVAQGFLTAGNILGALGLLLTCCWTCWRTHLGDDVFRLVGL